MNISENDIQLSQGIKTPYSASQFSLSPLSESDVLTHRCYPGLSGLVNSKVGLVPVIFVDKLPEAQTVYGRLISTTRLVPDELGGALPQPAWLIHVQDHFSAWHFVSHLDGCESVQETPVVVFLEWNPGSLQDAIAEHDDMFIKAAYAEDELLVGSDFEKESLSRLYLSTGLSSLANVHSASGAVDRLIKRPLEPIGLKSSSVHRGVAIPLAWTSKDE